MDEQSESRTLRALMYEHMLMSRHALQGSAPRLRSATLERSAAVLLARLEASGPLSVGELAEAFDLDVSTVHRQVAAAMKAGGRDNGPPGLRPHYHEHYYGAFVLDPDGFNVEAVHHAPVSED